MNRRKGFRVLLAILLVVSFCVGDVMCLGDITADAASWKQLPTNVKQVATTGDLSLVKEGIGGERYFYRQLTQEAKAFYDAMYVMYTEGIFKTGTESYDLVTNEVVTQEQLMAYANGDNQLISHMGAARDAFYADYPDIFYVDFSFLSIRVTMDAGGTYHAYLGTGRGEHYFVEGFTSQQQVEEAIVEYEARMEEIVVAARELSVEEGESLAEQQIKFVHDEIIRNTSYRLEHNCSKGNAGHIRTAYGALVKRESVCEGYSRAVKSVLDRLGITCILVQGGYRYSEQDTELHMWNYVKTEEDGEWYAVDATMDDPISRKGENGLDGYENSAYLLVGQDVMSRRHIPNGIMSEVNYEFSYPELAMIGCLFERIHGENELVVLYNKDGTFENLDAGIFQISYQGMGYAKAAEQGKYLLGRFHMYYETTQEWTYGEWGYLLPDIYPAFADTDTEITIPVPHCLYVEFAVTDVPPGDYLQDPDKTRFQGDQLLLEEETGMIYNPSGDYVAPPYIKSITPSVSARIRTGVTYHVKAVYNDVLQQKEGEEIGYQLVVPDSGTTAQEYSKIENFQWDGESTIEFDFMPSKMWADDSISYYFYITGLVGRKSLKAPNPISYYASQPAGFCALRCNGYNWNLFGKPALLENRDLSTEGWVTKDGSSVSRDMLDRLVLIASSTTNAQTDTMNDMISDSLSGGEQILKSETYNINLTICKCMVIQTGQAVRVCLGFPEGYGPNDAGVTFKAYHFDKNDAGEITGVQEIPCIITQYGLLILCDSFSPFAIAVVESDDAGTADTTKTVILSNTVGGKIQGADGVVALNQGDSQTLTIRADEGYEIDQLVLGGQILEITDRKEMTVTVNYQDITDGVCIVDAKFVAQTVLDWERERGETVVCPAAVPAEITLDAGEITVKEQEAFSIIPDIKEYGGIHTYQWYKDGVALDDQRNPALVVDVATIQDVGEYKLVVTTMADTVIARAESGICRVNVEPAQSGEGTPEPTPTEPISTNPTPSEPALPQQTPSEAGTGGTGTEEEKATVSLAKVTKVKAVSNAVNKVKLTWKKVEGAEGYYVLRFHEKKNKFVRIADVEKASYTDKTCVAGRGYRYQVRAYKTVNQEPVLGKKSSEVKIIAIPKAPKKVKGKWTGQTTARISFQQVEGAKVYYIYRYVEPEGEKEPGYYAAVPSYKVKGKKLYQYDSDSESWRYMSKIKVNRAKSKITFNLTGLNQKEMVLFSIQAQVSQPGYKKAVSNNSKVIVLSMPETR